jgi:hypothetical protein
LKQGSNDEPWHVARLLYAGGDRGNRNLAKGTVNEVCSEMADLPKLNKPELANAEHATDFEIPLYNVWKQQTKTGGSGHPGNSEVRWVDNLLYLYTKPFDIVVSTLSLAAVRLSTSASRSRANCRRS